MTLHITIEETTDPVAVPDCNDLLQLRDAVREIEQAMRAQAQTRGSAGVWGAVTALESALYYLHGAAAWLAKEEGLVP